MAAPIQIYLFALITSATTVIGQDIPLNFLDQALDGPPQINLNNRHRYPFDGFRLNHNIQNMFGPGGRFRPRTRMEEDSDPQNLFIGTPFGMYPTHLQHRATVAQGLEQKNVHMNFENKDIDSFKTVQRDRLPAPVTEVDELDIKPEDAVINTHSIAYKQKKIDAENLKFDRGPLKVGLLPEADTKNVEPALKTNEYKTTNSEPTVEPLLNSSLKRSNVEQLQTMPNTSETISEFVNTMTTERTDSEIIFPDQVDQIKVEMNKTPNSNNKTRNFDILNSTSDNDMHIYKNMDAVLVPVQVIPNQVSVMNMGVNSNGNNLMPLSIDYGQVKQVLPITNDIFPMTTQKAIEGELPMQRLLYTNIFSVLSQNGAQQAIVMPVKLSDTDISNNKNFNSRGLSDINPNMLNQNVGVPSDIPQNPVIAMLLTPANIKNVGSGTSNLISNMQQQVKHVSPANTPNIQLYSEPGAHIYTTKMQNFTPQTIPNNQENTQTTQYYLANGKSSTPVNGNNNNGQPIVFNLQRNSASNDPNVLSTDNTQKYMLVTINNQQNVPKNIQGNIYTAANSNINGQTFNNDALLNGGQQSSILLNSNVNDSRQSNLYTLVTLPNGTKNSDINNSYVDNVASNPGYQGRSTQVYSLVSLRDDDNNTKSLENINSR